MGTPVADPRENQRRSLIRALTPALVTASLLIGLPFSNSAYAQSISSVAADSLKDSFTGSLSDASSDVDLAPRQTSSFGGLPDWASQLLSNAPLQETRANQMAPYSHAFAINHIKRVLLKFALASYGQSDATRLKAFKLAEAHIEKFATQTRQILQLETMNDFEAQKAQEAPNFWNLADEVSFWRQNVPSYQVFTSQNPDVQQALERENEKDLHNQDPKLQADLSRLESLYARAVMHADQIHSVFAMIPDSARLDALRKIDVSIAQGLKQVDNVSEQITSNDNMKLPSKAWQRFFELILNQYFSMLEPQVKLNMLSQVMDLGANASPLDRFQVMVLNAGPQFQKLFQIYAREEGFSPELKEVFKKLEQASKSIPFRLVKPVIDGVNVPFKWISISPKPLGVGTMAQVHKAVIELTDKDGRRSQRKVVVRLLKPEVQLRVQQDNTALASLARVIDSDPLLRAENFPLISPFVEQIQEMTTRESKMDVTIVNQNLGAKLYNGSEPVKAGDFKGTLEYHVPEILALPQGSPIMIQEFIEGTSFDTFAAKSPELARVAVEGLSKKWLTETLIGSGFFHADLHQGNLRVNQVGDKVTVTLLDFGMTGKLSEDMQNKFVLYGLAASIQDPELMAKMLWEMSEKSLNQVTQAQLKRLFEVEVARQKAAGLGIWPSYEWVTLAVNAGMRFPIDITTLNRGVVLVLHMLQDVKSKMDLGTATKSIFLKNPGRLARLLKTQTYLTKSDWVKIGLQTYDASGAKPATDSSQGKPVTGVTNPAALMCREIFLQP